MTNTSPSPGAEREDRWQRLFRERGLIAQQSDASQSGLRITRLEMGPGRITASVADRDRGECEVAIDMPSWDDDQWAKVIDLLSRQALYAAQMLASDFPDDLEPMLQRQGLSLFPGPNEPVQASCTCCPTPGGDGRIGNEFACRHVSAALFEAGAMLADDAWLLLLLRGRVREQVLRALRRKRGQNGEGNGSAGYRNTLQNDTQDDLRVLGQGGQSGQKATSLSEDMPHFWGSARVQEEFRPHIVPPLAELMLLNRLGPPAFSHANEEVFDTLTNVYRRVTQSALALAYAEDLPEDSENTDDAGRT